MIGFNTTDLERVGILLWDHNELLCNRAPNLLGVASRERVYSGE
jgi:hypothetical protein